MTVAARHPDAAARAPRLRTPAPPYAFARPLRILFETLGVTFVKFGQLVASSPGVFGDERRRTSFARASTPGPLVPCEAVRRSSQTDARRAGRRRLRAPSTTRRSAAPRWRSCTAPRSTDGRVVAVKVLRARHRDDGRDRSQRSWVRCSTCSRFASASRRPDQLVRHARRLPRAADRGARPAERSARHGPPSRAPRGRSASIRIVVPEPLPRSPASACSRWTFSTACRSTTTPASRSARPRSPPAPRRSSCAAGSSPRSATARSTPTRTPGTSSCCATAGSASSTGASSGALDDRTLRFLRRTVEAALGDASAWNDIADEFLANYGPALIEGLGLDRDGLAQFCRSIVEPMLTAAVRRGEPREVPRGVARQRRGSRRPRGRASDAGCNASRASAASATSHVGVAQPRRPRHELRPRHVPAREAAPLLRALRQDVPRRHLLLEDRAFFERVSARAAFRAADDHRRGTGTRATRAR